MQSATVSVARLLAAALVAFVLYDSFDTDVQSETFTSFGASRKLKGARSSHPKAAHKTDKSSPSDSRGSGDSGDSGGKKKASKSVSLTDEDDEGAASSKTNDKKHTTTEQPVYDENGWHVSDDDFVTRVMHPQRLQPFYLMPVFFAVKLMITMLVFGFSLKFKKSTSGSVVAAISKVTKFLSGLAFIGIACYGYKTDFGRLHKHMDDCDSIPKKIGIFIIIWNTSANYVACRALWGSILIENPVTLLGLTPKYSTCPLSPIPLCPGGAAWLDPMKHVYALVLLPYFIPFYVVNLCSGCVMCLWLCSSKCAVLLQMCCGSINCCCALIGTIITLGFWAWAKDALGYWFGLLSPLYFMVGIQIWATVIAPPLFSMIFGCFLCSSMQNIGKGLAGAMTAAGPDLDQSAPTPEGAQPNQLLEAADRRALQDFNKDILEKDFEGYDLVPNEESREEGQTDVTVELEDTKIHIFGHTLAKMSSICIEQLSIIFLVRALTSTPDYSHYMGSLKRTLTERTWASYSNHLRTIAGRSTEEAINSINFLL